MSTLFSLFLFLQAILRAYSLASALKLTTQYKHGPISLSSDAEFFYSIDIGSSTASFAVVVNDSNIITNSSNWLGFGVSEPTGGSMLGSDIISAEFSDGQTSDCTFTDRYVPFYAYPLIESISDAPSAFPLADDCQGDGSWTLISCKRNAGEGQMILEVTRSLDAHDDQDRDIPPGVNNIIYAHGSSFAYHGARRSSVRINLYDKNDTKNVGLEKNLLPDNVDRAIEVQATGFLVPNDKATTYACTSKVINLQDSEPFMIVAAEPILNYTESPMVHHITFWLCRGQNYAYMIRKTIECTTGGSSIPGPIASGAAQCSTFVYGYAKGANRLVLPKEAGILVDDEYRVLIMETHYDNPDLVSGNIDFSGVRVYYTKTMREHEAGSLLMGDLMISRMTQKVMTGFQYEHSCVSACTQKFSEPVNYYSSLLHMHTTGREIYSNKFTANGTFIENMNKVNYWSDNFQNQIIFNPPKQIHPGDQIQLSCVFDTRKRPNTTFGLETKNEMCMEFAGYWPVQRDRITNAKINMCVFYRDVNAQGTFCGDIGDIDLPSMIWGPNPAFEDRIGSPTSFGTTQPTCDVMETPTPSPTPGYPPRLGDETPIPEVESTEIPNDNDDENACFPASATVQLRDGSKKRMDELHVGDSVMVGHNEYAEVFMFTHGLANIRYPFVQLSTSSGAVITLTRGHFLYLNDSLVRAGKAKPGDKVILGTGNEDLVTGVRMVTEQGLYNPQTLHGNIVVGGIVSSTYTHTVIPRMAHSLLLPLRMLHRCIQAMRAISGSVNWPSLSMLSYQWYKMMSSRVLTQH